MAHELILHCAGNPLFSDEELGAAFHQIHVENAADGMSKARADCHSTRADCQHSWLFLQGTGVVSDSSALVTCAQDRSQPVT